MSDLPNGTGFVAFERSKCTECGEGLPLMDLYGARVIDGDVDACQACCAKAIAWAVRKMREEKKGFV